MLITYAWFGWEQALCKELLAHKKQLSQRLQRGNQLPPRTFLATGQRQAHNPYIAYTCRSMSVSFGASKPLPCRIEDHHRLHTAAQQQEDEYHNQYSSTFCLNPPPHFQTITGESSQTAGPHWASTHLGPPDDTIPLTSLSADQTATGRLAFGGVVAEHPDQTAVFNLTACNVGAAPLIFPDPNIDPAAADGGPGFQNGIHSHEDIHNFFADESKRIRCVQPSGPRQQGQGVENEEQGIVELEKVETGDGMSVSSSWRVMVKVTLLAAGFIIGPGGTSIQAIVRLTGCNIKSGTEDERCRNRRPVRVFWLDGEKNASRVALEIMYDAIKRYKFLCEGRCNGLSVNRTQRIRGVDFSYRPPPRHIVPYAASLRPPSSGSCKKTATIGTGTRAKCRPGPVAGHHAAALKLPSRKSGPLPVLSTTSGFPNPLPAVMGTTEAANYTQPTALCPQTALAPWLQHQAPVVDGDYNSCGMIQQLPSTSASHQLAPAPVARQWGLTGLSYSSGASIPLQQSHPGDFATLLTGLSLVDTNPDHSNGHYQHPDRSDSACALGNMAFHRPATACHAPGRSKSPSLAAKHRRDSGKGAGYHVASLLDHVEAPMFPYNSASLDANDPIFEGPLVPQTSLHSVSNLHNMQQAARIGAPYQPALGLDNGLATATPVCNGTMPLSASRFAGSAFSRPRTRDQGMTTTGSMRAAADSLLALSTLPAGRDPPFSYLMTPDTGSGCHFRSARLSMLSQPATSPL